MNAWKRPGDNGDGLASSRSIGRELSVPEIDVVHRGKLERSCQSLGHQQHLRHLNRCHLRNIDVAALAFDIEDPVDHPVRAFLPSGVDAAISHHESEPLEAALDRLAGQDNLTNQLFPAELVSDAVEVRPALLHAGHIVAARALQATAC